MTYNQLNSRRENAVLQEPSPSWGSHYSLSPYLHELGGRDVLRLVVVGVLENDLLHHFVVVLVVHHLPATTQEFVEHIAFDKHGVSTSVLSEFSSIFCSYFLFLLLYLIELALEFVHATRWVEAGERRFLYTIVRAMGTGSLRALHPGHSTSRTRSVSQRDMSDTLILPCHQSWVNSGCHSVSFLFLCNTRQTRHIASFRGGTPRVDTAAG